VDVPPNLVWDAWTKPEHIVHWFTPVPWKTIEARCDLKPGGEFYTVMQSPEGEKFPNAGCYLEVIENKKLVWTSALKPGFRPTPNAENGADNMLFTAMIFLEPSGKGTKYTAIAIHSKEKDKKTHEDMGFEHGWGAALAQLVEYMKTGKSFG
jgi:uncharacterized protein YndB with AHSA1/START domain